MQNARPSLRRRLSIRIDSIKVASDDKQWRKENASAHLKGQRFRFKRYTRYREDWDHDHCAACWAKFAEPGHIDEPDIQHEGYATTEEYKLGADYAWVCVQCFSDLKDDLGWVVAP